MTEFKYLRWYHFEGRLSCEPYASLLDAVREIELLRWSDDAYLYDEYGIEGPDGWVSPGEERDAFAELGARERQRVANTPMLEPVVVRLSIQALDSGSGGGGEWVVYDEFTARQIQQGWVERDCLVELVGDDRVRWEDIE